MSKRNYFEQWKVNRKKCFHMVTFTCNFIFPVFPIRKEENAISNIHLMSYCWLTCRLPNGEEIKQLDAVQ